MNSRVVVMNIGWMRDYRGILNTNDRIRGGGAYVDKHGYGHELFNFQEFRGKYLGYVQPVGVSLNLERLGASKGAEFLEQVTVIWVSKEPGGQTCIIGWYTNATLFRRLQAAPKESNRTYNGESFGYFVTADSKDCKLLKEEERVFPVPRARKTPGGIGQSNVWYPDKSSVMEWLDKAVSYIARDGKGSPERINTARKRRRLANVERRLAVEQKAIQIVCEYFEEIGYQVDSVEREKCGWDLEATAETGQKKLLEVKGISGELVSFELTPHELQKLEQNRTSYFICVVTSALDKEPLLQIFSYASEYTAWVDEGGNSLDFDLKMGARVRLATK